MSPAIEGSFSTSVVRWQKIHGRHSLPWQGSTDPYRVWLSEIMLQQTQVVTVLGFYQRFLERFPTVSDLAAATEDEVLALWSGLGYYSRARNLHKAARQVMEDFDGVFPHSASQLVGLAGIGRSTAGAIAAFCFGERVPILDANVKRVLTRFLAFEGDLSRSANEKMLWTMAEKLVPKETQDMQAYTQGLMDLGATVCVSSKPSCLVCPLSSGCRARASGLPERFPVRTKTLKRRTELWWLLVLLDETHRVWLEKRPVPGIWAGLQCPPIFRDEGTMRAAASLREPSELSALPVVRHVLTHRDLILHPWVAFHSISQYPSVGAGQWASKAQLPGIGLPAPVRKLLDSIL